MSWKIESFGALLTESRIPCENPDIEKRIRVKLNVQGVEKRPIGAEKEGATKQFIRKAGQFIYGKQNFHKGAFGVIPPDLDGFETSADIPSFDVREDCLPEWIYYFFKSGNRYLELTEYARGVGSQRIHPKQLTELQIPLPPLEVQIKIIEELKIIEKDEISTQLSHQLDLVKQLRQAFLREAMQGKLVPQDPKDEPASVLLEKIKAEKERLVKEKKIKKQKPMPPITEEEIPFEIPENWVWCRLGEIAEIGTGATPLTSNDDYYKNGTVPWITSSATNNLFVESPEQYITQKAIKETNCKVYPSGTLVVAMYGQGKTRGQITELMFDAATNQACATITLHLKDFFLRKFVKQFFQKIYLEIRELAQGGAQPNLNMGKISNTIIPIPPLSEQQRIVAKLDELMGYCDELEASIKESQQQNELLLQQVLREALEPKEREVGI